MIQEKTNKLKDIMAKAGTGNIKTGIFEDVTTHGPFDA